MEYSGFERSSNDTKKKSSLIPEGLLPSYLATAFGELYEDDGIAVFAKGLGWLSLLASFVRFYADAEHGHLAIMRENEESNVDSQEGKQKNIDDNDDDAIPFVPSTKMRIKPPLVLVLGMKDAEHDALMSILESWGTPHAMLPTIITNESGQGKDRAMAYQKGGVFCVTSRILIVDLLTNVLKSQDVDGMLVAHADQVTNESTEAFILRIYTSQKRRDKCFIKGFTDAPDQLLSGFAKIDKTLKALQVRNLYLYPRFHEGVKDELDLSGSPPDVVELHQPLSPAMKEIQKAIVAAVQTCMRELKASTPFVEWTGDDLSIQNCVTSSFDRAVSRQLEKDWHRLKPQTKQLVHDLKTLRTLFQSLIQFDCVHFWKLINRIKTSSAEARHPSMWLLTSAADRLFRKAKERIYKIEAGAKPTTQVPNPVKRLVPILEENPKWRLLKNVLSEIKEVEQRKFAKAKEKMSSEDDDFAVHQQATILVLVKEESSMDSLRSYLVEGRDRTLALKFLRYLEHYNDRSRSVNGGKISEESRLLLEEEQRVRRILFGDRRKKTCEEKVAEKQGKRSAAKAKLNEVPDYVRKRRRIAMEKSRGRLTGGLEDRERDAILAEAMEMTEHDLADKGEETRGSADERDADDVIFEDMFRISMHASPRIVIKTFKSFEGDAGLILSDIDPSYVIMYDTDVALVRAIEVFAAMSNGEVDPLKIYFLVFEASAEQKVFHKSLEREQSAFVRLIHHKKTMPPPVLHVDGTQEMQQALSSGIVANTYAGGTLPLAFDSRRGQGKTKNSEKRDIAVDVREFRSALPSILHQGGMRLAPVTLTVGDFVLSNVHCVERKSISDLFQSFASGRLYTQAEAMSKYYKVPALLIEFDPSKTFCLQNSNDLGMDIKNESVCSKMVILTKHFPKLRILWSRSPHETLKIFKELKSNHEEVDVEKALDIGRKDSVEALLQNEDDEDEDEINEAARDMLLRLPGVTIHSARRIMRECDTLADLIQMDRNDLRRLAGASAGQKLFTFFRQRFGGI